MALNVLKHFTVKMAKLGHLYPPRCRDVAQRNYAVKFHINTQILIAHFANNKLCFMVHFYRYISFTDFRNKFYLLEFTLIRHSLILGENKIQTLTTFVCATEAMSDVKSTKHRAPLVLTAELKY